MNFDRKTGKYTVPTAHRRSRLTKCTQDDTKSRDIPRRKTLRKAAAFCTNGRDFWYERPRLFERTRGRSCECCSLTRRGVESTIMSTISLHNDQLHLFRRLEKCSKRLACCEGAIEFLNLCNNLGLVPTFARVDNSTKKKWKRSAQFYKQQVIKEELHLRFKDLKVLRQEINLLYNEVRDSCSVVRYTCILKHVSAIKELHYKNVISRHTKKIARMMACKTDINKHINNLSSAHLSFFEKLVISRGLKFALPQHTSSSTNEILASFEKVCRTLDRSNSISTEEKQLAFTTLRSIAVNYSNRKGPRTPKQLLRAIKSLKTRDDIIITRPDKGNGVVVMDKCDYIRLLREASIDKQDKFTVLQEATKRGRGRPRKVDHPVLAKEREVLKVLNRILPSRIAAALTPVGSRLAHIYGLPKTHKQKLSMRPILSATNSYNFKLAKWLDEKLSPLSTNCYTVTDVYKFLDNIKTAQLSSSDILVSYDVESLFTNVPVDETIDIIVKKAFTNNWFNLTHDMDLTECDLKELLTIATKNQLFTFQGKLYEQIDGVAMGSPLGPLMANYFMCSIEEEIASEGFLPPQYHRFVDDTFTIMPANDDAEKFLERLNSSHPKLRFTMEIAAEGSLPFLGAMISNINGKIETEVYHKPTDSGLLLHFESHVDEKYKRALLQTLLLRASRLSSKDEYFQAECNKLRKIFLELKYPLSSINFYISKSTKARAESGLDLPVASRSPNDINIVLPFKDQTSANSLKKQMADLSNKIGQTIRPVFTSRKIENELRVCEEKPALLSRQCVVYIFECDSCEANYVGYTCRHLHQRTDEHKRKGSAIHSHVTQNHQKPVSENDFKVLKKCKDKYDCLVHEMLAIRRIKPTLNTMSDSIRSRLFP